MTTYWAWVKRVWVPLGSCKTPDGAHALKRWAWSRGWPVREGIKGRKPSRFAPREVTLPEGICWALLQRLEARGEVLVHVDRHLGLRT